MDPTTVITILALNLLCAGGLFFAIGRRVPPRQGLGLFAAGTSLFGLAYGVRLLVGVSSSGWFSLLPDGMMVGAGLLLIGGLRQQVGREAGTWAWLAAALGGFLLIQALAIATSGAWGRHLWLNLALGVVYSVLAGESLHEARHGPPVLRLPLWLMAVLMAGLASLTLARSLWVAVAGITELHSGWPAQLYYGYALVAALLLSPTLQWMVFSRLNQQLADTALRDTLTGVLNRAGLAEAVARHWGTRPRRELVLMQIDVDHFKAVNDEHGHAIGDQVLQAVARTLATMMRGGDLLARVGGEEFLAVCIELHPLAARAMAERLREAVAQLSVPIAATASNLSCTVSVGVSRPCDKAESFQTAWREADQAMFEAKRAGRDRVRMVATLQEVQLEPAGSAAAARAITPVPAASDAIDVDTTPEGLLNNLPPPVPPLRAAD